MQILQLHTASIVITHIRADLDAGATDRGHAERVAAAAGLTHHIIETNLDELLQELPWVVRTLQGFDPMALRNDIAGEFFWALM